MLSLVERAEIFATKTHSGQLRKDGITPYIEHPRAVVRLLMEAGVNNDDILASAWLHDVIEDCDVIIDEIKQEFNNEVARVVAALTRDCSREEYSERIRKADLAVQLVKIADMVHNCQSIIKEIPPETIKRKIYDCKKLYFELSKKVSPYLYKKLEEATGPWMK